MRKATHAQQVCAMRVFVQGASLYLRISVRVGCRKFHEDALHIAIATIHKVDVLVSWNFKHIVNLDRIKKYNGVNLKHGYMILEIRNPREILIEK